MDPILPAPALPQAEEAVAAPPYPTLKESWGILGWYLVVIFAVAIPGVLILEVGFSQSRTVTTMVLIGVVNPVLLVFLRWKAGARWQPLQLKGREQLWLYAVLPLFVLALATVLSLLNYLHLPNTIKETLQKTTQTPQLAASILVVVGPLFEELLFRGVMLQGLLRRYRPWVAIGQSALLFGILHFNPAQSVNALLLGLVFGWLYYRTRSLWLCIALHMLFNSLAFVGILVSASSHLRKTSTVLSHSPWWYAALVALSALIVAATLWRVHQTTTVAAEEASAPKLLDAIEEPEMA